MYAKHAKVEGKAARKATKVAECILKNCLLIEASDRIANECSDGVISGRSATLTVYIQLPANRALREPTMPSP